MRITDRMEELAGVVSAHWDSAGNRLIVYYQDTVPVDTIMIRIAGALQDASLQDSIDTTTLISC